MKANKTTETLRAFSEKVLHRVILNVELLMISVILGSALIIGLSAYIISTVPTSITYDQRVTENVQNTFQESVQTIPAAPVVTFRTEGTCLRIERPDSDKAFLECALLK